MQPTPTSDLKPQPSPREQQLHETLADLIVATNRLTRMAAKSTGSTQSSASWVTLSVLGTTGPMRLGQLAIETRVSQPTATKLVQNLGELGWVKRVQDAEDARAVQIAATPEGTAALAAWRTQLSTTLAPLFDDLSGDDLDHVQKTAALLRKRAGLPGPVSTATSATRVIAQRNQPQHNKPQTNPQEGSR